MRSYLLSQFISVTSVLPSTLAVCVSNSGDICGVW